MYRQLSNLYINYYYGSYVKLNERWGEKDVACPFSKAYYITQGECEFKILGKIYHAHAGDFFMIPAGTNHSFYHINNNFIKKYWFHFELNAGGINLFNLVKMPYCIHIGTDRHIISLFRSILKLSAEDTPNNELLLNSRILELVFSYLDMSCASFIANDDSETVIIKTISDYINTNISRNISINELASLAHFHPNYFVRFFKEHMGVPPAKYINNVRIEQAKSMLENTTMPIKEIMNLIGLDEYSHFSKFFKKYTGYSPNAFRNYFSKL